MSLIVHHNVLSIMVQGQSSLMSLPEDQLFRLQIMQGDCSITEFESASLRNMHLP